MLDLEFRCATCLLWSQLTPTSLWGKCISEDVFVSDQNGTANLIKTSSHGTNIVMNENFGCVFWSPRQKRSEGTRKTAKERREVTPDHVKFFMSRRRWTQTQLATALGIDRRRVNEWLTTNPLRKRKIPPLVATLLIAMGLRPKRTRPPKRPYVSKYAPTQPDAPKSP